MTMGDYVWLCAAMCGFGRLFVAMCSYMSLCVATCGYV